ncbi:S24 family peptidase [Conchiformibius steedae]|uniref:S24 family peptidase n=1 Tax=Conchiformibius steedae TaxID=153493 RepID=A0A3P2A754_9NEIS|nr:S24 family peptidase [Conchiformibius steedae]RRD90080.1 S24 family peptidase [Conchiformibius steedae]
MYPKFSIAELVAWQNQYGLELPKTERGLSLKVKREGWEYEEVSGKGGPGGVKKIFALPDYLINELTEKGLLHLLETDPSVAHTATPPSALYDLPLSMQPAFSQYQQWAAEQDRKRIVPIRYYSQVFASAGNGNIVWDTNCDVMWFRASFIQQLAVEPAHCFCTRVQGDSMFPTLIDRGAVLWHATARFTGEGVYLFRQYDEIRVKRLVRTAPDRYQIISDNPNKSIYPTVELDLSRFEPHEFELYGKYLWSAGVAG